jgi:hypothetical protein
MITRSRRLIAAAAIAGAMLATPAHAAELLGCRNVGFINDTDVIQVGRQDGRFRAIQLRVRGNDIAMRDLKVIYGNGAPDDLPVRADIRAGGETRWIDLRGGARFIREIVLTYASRPNFRGQAEVCVFGR